MTTPSFGLTATERVLPRLALDFTTASLDPRVTFTRTGNTATVTNSSGYVTTINADLPRFDYNPITLVCKGLLIEEARTNLLTYSEDFTSGWTAIEQTITTDNTISPDGTQNADKIAYTAVSSSHVLFKDATLVSGTTYTQSIYVKANGQNFFQIYSSTGFAANQIVTFNLSTGLVQSSSSFTGTITSVGNGWYRVTATGVANASGAGRMVLRGTPSALGVGVAYTGNGTDGVFLWGAQLEAGAFATSYIPTTTTALTRNADVASMTGTNFSDWYNQTQGSMIVQASTNAAVPAAKYPFLLTLGTGSTNDRHQVLYDGDTQLVAYQERASGTQYVSITQGAITAGVQFKAGINYKTDNFNLSFNAGSPANDNAGVVPTNLNRFQIGMNYANAQQWNGHFQKFWYYPQQITNAELQSFTK